jgi:hypothetical protein
VYAVADAASQRRLNMTFRACLRYIHSLRRLDHVSHLQTSVMSALLADYARIQILSFLYEVLHVRHPCYLFSLFRFTSSARTRNLVVPAHRSLAMSQFFVVLDYRAWIALPDDFTYACFNCFRCEEDVSWRCCFELSYLFVFTHVFCFYGTHHVIGC